MDKFFDRLGDLLQSLIGGESRRDGSYDPRDPDIRAAIEELDAYLESGGFASEGGASEQSRDRSDWKPESADEGLRRDYATLEVAFAAPLAEVRKSYKRLLHKYHPDRFSDDAEKQAVATEVTQRLNDAFRRIEGQQKGRK